MKALSLFRRDSLHAWRRSSVNLALATLFVALAIFSSPMASAQQNVRSRSDFDGDNRADFAVFRPSEGVWYVQGSTFLDFQLAQHWGTSTDVPVPGDYNNDGAADFAVWRPSEGNWYIKESLTGAVSVRQWGLASIGDVPVQADYDGDGKTDIAVWRAPEGNWYIVNSSDGSVTLRQWGQFGDKPVQMDYDGDGRADLAYWRPSDGTWHILNSSFGAQGSTAPQATVRQWGLDGDVLVPDDYDGDFKADLAVWRPSVGDWYIINSKTNTVTQRNWGAGSIGDIPVPEDYDGDFKSDIAIFRPSEGNWYYLASGSGSGNTSSDGASFIQQPGLESDGTAFIQQWGLEGDVPVVTAYLHE